MTGIQFLQKTKFNVWKHLKTLDNFKTLHINTRSFSKLVQSYDHQTSNKRLLGKTIGQVLQDSCDRFPDQEAAVFFRCQKRITYSELNEKANQLAASFIGLGLTKGDRVGIWGQNHLEWMITLFAAAKSRTILVNVNPAYKSNELKYALNKVGVKALVMSPSFKTSDYYQILKNVAPELEYCNAGRLESKGLPHLESVVLTEGPAMSGTFSFEDALSIAGSEDKEKLTDIQKHIRFDDPVNIQFTSGTTGNPKGATLTHHNLVNNADAIGLGLDYSEKDRICLPVPLYHCFGMVLGCLSGIMNGCTLVYPERGFDAGATLEAIQHEKCTSIYGTPAMFIDMLNHTDFSSIDFSSIRTGIMAGSPCPVEVMKNVIDDMNCKEMTIAYGLTETSPATNLTARDAPVELRVSSIGRIIPHVEVKVVDEAGQIVPVNTPGELCFRGHCIFQGYWDDEEKTNEALDQNGWFHSGDLGQIDENGYCKVVGRLKDMVIRGGENIYPTEIENFLHEHPDIEDVQVIGVPDSRLGEELCAWIRLKRNRYLTAEDVKAICKGKISHYKIPRYIEFVEEYPMTVTGKVKKVEMRKLMAEKMN